MRRTNQTPDLVVVGAGVIGLAVAWRAAQRGVAVTIVDDSVGRGASWAAAGMLAPVTEAHYGEEALLALNLASARRYPSFVEELEACSGIDVDYVRSGTLMVARHTDDLVALEEMHRYRTRLGLEVDKLNAGECRELEPALSPRVRGGLWSADDNRIDARRLTSALLEAARRAGVVLVASRVSRVDIGDRGLRGVVLVDGTQLASRWVVLAAGSWSGEIGGLPEEARPPVRPVKGQVVHLRRMPELRPITHNVRGVDVYLVPRGDSRLVLGATVEEAGYDVAVTAEAVYQLLKGAYELVPGILHAELLETVAGLRPGSPDNAPMVGETTVEGLILATGHYRNGILLTPLTADAVVELLETGAVPPGLAPYSPRRFVREEAVG